MSAKRFALVAVFCSPFVVFAQQIKVNRIEPFTNEHVIETSLVSLKHGFSGGIGISYLAINQNYLLNILSYGKSSPVNEEDKVWFVLEDGSTVQFNKRAEVEEEEGTDGIFIRRFYVNLVNVEQLKNKKAVILRIASPGNKTTDYPINKRNAKELLKLNEIFLNEVGR